MNTTPPLIVGMVWYEPEDYVAIKALMHDGHRLPGTYESWKLQAENFEEIARSTGRRTVRVVLKPEAFRDFCRRNGLNVDSEGRKRFANFGALQAYRDGSV